MYKFKVEWYDRESGCHIIREVVLDREAIIDMALDQIRDTEIYKIVYPNVASVVLESY